MKVQYDCGATGKKAKVLVFILLILSIHHINTVLLFWFFLSLCGSDLGYLKHRGPTQADTTYCI